MSAPIDTYLRHINEKEWASEVRAAIVNAIRECYNNTEDPELRTDALEAAIQVKIDTGQMAALTIGDGTITAVKLANNSVTTSKIADGNVTTPKIADGSITQEKLDPNMQLVTVDGTLSHTGEAADAKATGDAISEINGSLENLDTISPELKSALINIASHAYYDTPSGTSYVSALVSALYKDDDLLSISAVFTKDTPTPDTITLDYLRDYLTVTADYTGGISVAVTDYTLSGTIEEGVCEITVTYKGKTDTFEVVISYTEEGTDVSLKSVVTGLGSTAFYTDGGETAYTADGTLPGNNMKYIRSNRIFDTDTQVKVTWAPSSQSYCAFLFGSTRWNGTSNEGDMNFYWVTSSKETTSYGWKSAGTYEFVVTVKAGYALCIIGSASSSTGAITKAEVVE